MHSGQQALRPAYFHPPPSVANHLSHRARKRTGWRGGRSKLGSIAPPVHDPICSNRRLSAKTGNERAPRTPCTRAAITLMQAQRSLCPRYNGPARAYACYGRYIKSPLAPLCRGYSCGVFLSFSLAHDDRISFSFSLRARSPFRPARVLLPPEKGLWLVLGFLGDEFISRLFWLFVALRPN